MDSHRVVTQATRWIACERIVKISISSIVMAFNFIQQAVIESPMTIVFVCPAKNNIAKQCSNVL